MREYADTIKEIRKFNRFYTVSMGFLNTGYLDTEYSIAETRSLFEIYMHGKCFQSELVKILHIDKSYLNRIIKRFDKNGLLEKNKSHDDKRATYISLTEKGRRESEKLMSLTDCQIEHKINMLSMAECNKLSKAMNTIIAILEKGNTHGN